MFIENQGCEECDGCHHALLDTTDALHAQLKPVVEELSTVTKSYYTTQKLKRLNEEAEELKPEVEKLDPNVNNLSEQMQEVDSLEMDTKNHIKKSNYNDEKAMDLKKASADLLKGSNEDSKNYQAVTQTVLNTIKEVADLATNLDLDEKSTRVERAVEQAEEFLDLIKTFDPEIIFKPSPKADQCNADLVFGDVDKFASPIKEQKENLDTYQKSLEDYNKKLDDLRGKSRDIITQTIAIRDLNAKNKESRLKQNLQTVSDLLKEAEDGLKDGKSLKNNSTKLLADLDLSFGDAERLSKELENLNKDLDQIFPKNEDEYREVAPLVQRVLDHVIGLEQKKSDLANQYSSITANSNDAIKAVSAYAEIEGDVKIAKNKSQEAFDDATEALNLLDGISDRAGKSHQASNDLVHEGRDALSNVQSDLSPSLQKSKDDLVKIKQDIDMYTNKLKSMNDSVDNINSDPYTELWKLIIKNADEALDLKLVSNATLQPVLENVEQAAEKTTKISKDVEDTNKDIILASSQVQKVGELVPGIIGLIDQVEEKNKKIDDLSSQLNTDLDRLRRQIDQARNIANSIKLGVQFMPNTTLELKTPENIQAQTFNTKISTHFKTDKPHGLLLYLGNEQKPSQKPKRADFMAIEIENGYPVLIIDVGDGPERVINNKKVDDNKWYQAIVDRKGKDVTFTIREEDDFGNETLRQEKQTLAGEQTSFRLDENSKLIVGGFSEIQVPDSIKQYSFEGEIEGLKIGDNDIGLWNFVDAENTNGAFERDRLIAKEAKYTGYRFGGNGYVVLDARPFNFKQRSHISFKFRAARDSPNGLLFFVGSEEHYISLELRDGNVVFRFKLGQASQIVEIKTEHHFNDDEWHTVAATRESGEGELVVDDHRLYESTLYNSDAYRTPDKMYFGGYPDRMFLSGIQTRNFDGCIDDVQIEGTPIDLTRNIESHDVLAGCPQKFSSVVGFAAEKYGYLKLRNLTVGNKLNINLKFKTIQSHGVLFYGMNNDQSATISLGIEDGILVFRSSKYELNTDITKFDDGEWHVVTAMHDERRLKLSIDDIYDFISPEAPPSLYINFGEIYFGGLPLGFRSVKGGLSNEAYFVGCIQDVTINNNVINFATSTDKSNAIFNSCPRDIIDYNKYKVLRYYPNGQIEQPKQPEDIDENIITDDRDSQPKSDAAPPPSVETTTARRAEEVTVRPAPITTTTAETTTTKVYSIDQKHPECKLPVMPEYDVDFDSAGFLFGTKPSSYVEFEPSPDQTRTAYDFSLTFRTDKQDGLLFYASDDRHTDYVSIYLKHGYINHVFFCGGAAVNMTSEKQFDDGNWHTISILRENKKVLFRDASGEEKKQELKVKCRNMDLRRNYFVGGASERDVEDIELNLKFETGYFNKHAFFGCIKDVKLDNRAVRTVSPISDNVLPCSDETEKGVFFGKSGGYVKLRDKFKVGTDTTISMDIKPRNLTGVLTSVHGKKSFFIVEMIKGNIHFSVDSGDGPRTVVFTPDSDQSLCDGNWHTVTVIKSRFILSINVGMYKAILSSGTE